MRNLTKGQERYAEERQPSVKSALMMMNDEWLRFVGRLETTIDEPHAARFLYADVMSYLAQYCDSDLLKDISDRQEKLIGFMADKTDRSLSLRKTIHPGQSVLTSPDAYFEERAWEDAREEA